VLRRAWVVVVGKAATAEAGGGDGTPSAAHIARAEQYELDPLRAISTF